MPNKHLSPIKNPKQLVVVLVLALVVPIAVIVMLAQYVTGAPAEAKNDAAAVLSRIKPVGDLVLASDVPPPAASATASSTPPVVASAAAPSSTKPDGKKTYEATCVACHGSGVAGAPKLGDKAAWAPRLKAGIDGMYASALKGKAAMPAKGGNAALPDADVKAAVDYLVAAAK